MKHADGWKLSRLLKSKSKRVKVMHFSGVTAACTESYIKPMPQQNTDKVILHIGTNDLRSKKEPLEVASNIISLSKTCRENGCDTIISEILPRGDKLNKKAQEVNIALHELCESENLWIIKYQNFKPRYHLNQSNLHPNCKGTNMIEANFKKFFNDLLVNIRNFSSRNFANNINKPGLHFENSNVDEYDIDSDKPGDEKDSGKDKCVCSFDILPATEMSGNAHEDLKISFEDSYDDCDDNSAYVTVTEHSSRDKVNANESLSKLKDIKLKNINHVIIAQFNINSMRNKFDFLKETVAGYVSIFLITESKLDNSFPTAQL